MEYVILGLLALQPRTIYQLRKRVNEGLNLAYSCSTGSIQAALKKLLNGGYIGVNGIEEDGKAKKLYSLTNMGKEYFYDWINGAFASDAPKNSELAKIYFMGFADRENRVKAIENHVADLQIILSSLQKILEDGERFSAEEKKNDILFFQLKTAEYGRDFIKFNIDWYDRFLKAVKER